MIKMDIKISTRNELENRMKELDSQFNSVRDKLADYIESTKSKIENMTKQMDKLSTEYKEIKEELDKRDGNTNNRKQ